MKIIAALYLILGIIGILTMSYVLLAQYNVITNVYSTLNREAGAKTIIWFMFAACILFIVVGITDLRNKRK